VAGTYKWLRDVGPPTCGDDGGKALAYPILITVATKGEIHAAVAEAPQCVDEETLLTQTQTFTITGSTGIYEGAAGSGTLEHALGPSSVGGSRFGRQTWTGTLSVPGLDFDLTRPTLMGAGNKAVIAKKGAKTARVVFKVTAQDDRDGAVPVTCAPRSGTRFRVGRTRVTCSATDSSVNTATASFRVTVRAAR
jgi:hypothetical protein